nr:PREDICTED: cathepsin B isoform X2 [Tribolium castaneum]|eukprot:XP_015838505.1 PREDICTED: cathepsin B isoform X2 [Tribolium castaneum]
MKSLVLLLALFLPKSSPKTPILSQQFINAINQKHPSWLAGPNFPPNTPHSHLRSLNGARDDPAFFTDTETKNVTIPEQIPQNFDARIVWPQCESIRKIRNQGSCGSCWAFGAVETMSDRLCIASNATKKFEFSAQDLLACCKECGHGCGGGYSSRAWQYWVTDGIVSGGDFNTSQGCHPYSVQAFRDSTTPNCSSFCTNPKYQKNYSEDKRYGARSYRIAKNIEQIQAEIMTSGPVQASYVVYDDFYSYQNGVYQHVLGNVSGRHSVKILGWGRENGTDYWLVANSWGRDWGRLGGFFKFLRGENHCDIESNILGGDPKI